MGWFSFDQREICCFVKMLDYWARLIQRASNTLVTKTTSSSEAAAPGASSGAGDLTGLRRGSSSTTPLQLPAGATTPHAPHSPATSSLLLTRRSQGKLRRCTRVCEERGRMHTHQLAELLSAKSPVQMRYTNKTEPHSAAAAPLTQPPLCTQAAVITEVNTRWKKNK